MTENLSIGDFVAAPGSKTTGIQRVEVADQQVEVPLFMINGTEDGPTLAVTAGIHGAEYASIAAALEVGQTLEPKKLKGRVIIAPVANMPAFRARSVHVCPLDGVNLNRVFPGKADGTASEQLAYWLFQNVILKSNVFVDMHGGDLVEALVPLTYFCYTGNKVVDQKSLELARVFGIPYIASEKTGGGAAYSEAAFAGIPAILSEAGAQGIWPPEAVAAHVNGLNRLMRHLGILEGPTPEPLQTKLLDRFPWLHSEHDGYYYPKVSVGDDVCEGQDVGAVTDFEGRVLQAVNAPVDGKVLFLMSSLAINKGDALLAVGT